MTTTKTVTEVTYCDRCHKDCKDKDVQSLGTGASEVRGIYMPLQYGFSGDWGPGWPFASEKVDFCPKCTRSFIDWANNK